MASILGWILGMLLGSLSPTMSAMVVSSGGGSVLALFTGATLGTRFGLPMDDGPASDARLWLVVWSVMLIIGLGVQWRRERKKADKTA